MKTQQRQRPVKQRTSKGPGGRLPECGAQIHVLARVMHYVRTPHKPHPVLGAVIPIKNKVDHYKSERPAPHRVGYVKDTKLIEEKVQADECAAGTQAHNAVDAQLRHRAGEVFECVHPTALQ